MTDLEAMGRSGRVSGAMFNRYLSDEQAVNADLDALPAYRNAMDPFYTFEAHFAGFVRGAKGATLPPGGLAKPVPGTTETAVILN